MKTSRRLSLSDIPTYQELTGDLGRSAITAEELNEDHPAISRVSDFIVGSGLVLQPFFLLPGFGFSSVNGFDVTYQLNKPGFS